MSRNLQVKVNIILPIVLRYRACAQPQQDGSPCADCEHATPCVYGWLFESQDSNGHAIARPYLLEPLFPQRTHYAPGETFEFNLLLVGRSLDAVELCIAVFRQLGRRGLGLDYKQGLGRFEIERIEGTSRTGEQVAVYGDGATENRESATAAGDSALQPVIQSVSPLDGAALAAWTSDLAPLTPHRVALYFMTPLHLRAARPPRPPLREGEVEFSHLWDALQRRIEDLMLHHCGQAYQSPFPALKKGALAIRKVEDSLRWQPQPRRTSKHQVSEMGGLLGHIVFEGDLAPFLPVLAIGEWIHVGHGTDLGNGRYHLLPGTVQRPL